MGIIILEQNQQGCPVGKAKYTFLLQTAASLDQLKTEYPHKGKAVDGSMAVVWNTGDTYALFPDGWILGGG
jgi:sulfur transfer protein SufE